LLKPRQPIVFLLQLLSAAMPLFTLSLHFRDCFLLLRFTDFAFHMRPSERFSPFDGRFFRLLRRFFHIYCFPPFSLPFSSLRLRLSSLLRFFIFLALS